MQMALRTHRWTRADLERLPDDGNRYEVLDGELFVTPLPSPPHQVIALRIMTRLQPYLDRYHLGTVVGPGAVVFGSNELQPDVVVFPVRAAAVPRTWSRLPRPTLVVEVLSPTTRLRDLDRKRRAYQRRRIPDYWVIDAAERRALWWRAGSRDPVVVRDALEWQPRADIEPLVIELRDVLPPRMGRRKG